MHHVIAAALLLAVGLLVYLIDRPAEQIYFVPDGWPFAIGAGEVFGPVGAHLPTFIHVVVFTLVSSALLAPWHFRTTSICLLWFSIDSLFELAQHKAFATQIAAVVPGWFQGIPFLENTSNYFVAGTFDFLDLMSIALGSVSAYLIIHYFRMRESDNVTK